MSKDKKTKDWSGFPYVLFIFTFHKEKGKAKILELETCHTGSYYAIP